MKTLPSLLEIPLGKCALIQAIDAGMVLRERMAALGLRPGREVRVLRRAWLRGPLQIRAGSTEIIIRRGEAARIRVSPCPQETP